MVMPIGFVVALVVILPVVGLVLLVVDLVKVGAHDGFREAFRAHMSKVYNKFVWIFSSFVMFMYLPTILKALELLDCQVSHSTRSLISAPMLAACARPLIGIWHAGRSCNTVNRQPNTSTTIDQHRVTVVFILNTLPPLTCAYTHTHKIPSRPFPMARER
jgi:hypothetical protein